MRGLTLGSVIKELTGRKSCARGLWSVKAQTFHVGTASAIHQHKPRLLWQVHKLKAFCRDKTPLATCYVLNLARGEPMTGCCVETQPDALLQLLPASSESQAGNSMIGPQHCSTVLAKIMAACNVGVVSCS